MLLTQLLVYHMCVTKCYWSCDVCCVCMSVDKLRSGGDSMRKTGNSFKESNVEKGMVLPFTPLTMTFHDVHYFVDCPPVSHIHVL